MEGDEERRATPAPLPPSPPGVALPDPDDWSVIAMAIVARAPTILTWNRVDFPRAVLELYDLVARTPDRWCAQRLIDLQHAGGAEDVDERLRGHLATLRRPTPWTPEQYREMLRWEGYRWFEALIPPEALR